MYFRKQYKSYKLKKHILPKQCVEISKDILCDYIENNKTKITKKNGKTCIIKNNRTGKCKQS